MLARQDILRAEGTGSQAKTYREHGLGIVVNSRIRVNNLVGERIDCTVGRVIAPAAPAEEIGLLKKENGELRQLNRRLGKTGLHGRKNRIGAHPLAPMVERLLAQPVLPAKRRHRLSTPLK